MPLFFFISGFIFKYNRNLGKYKSFKLFVRSKFKRLLIPYFLIGLFYVSPMKLLLGDYTLHNYFNTSTVNILLGINPSQLWYLLALFNIFVVYYVTKSILNSFSSNWVLDILLLVIFIFLKLFISTGFTIFQIGSTLDYILYFHIGCLTCQYIKNRYHTKLTTIMLILIHALLFIASETVSSSAINFITTIIGIYAYYSLAITLTNLFKNMNKSWLYRLILNNNLNIYLFHQQIIQLILTSVVIRKLPPILNISITFFVSVILSILIGKIIKSIKSRLFVKLD